MFDKYFSQVYNSVQRRKRLVVWLLVIATVASVMNLRSVSFDNNIELMLPRNDEVSLSMDFLRESHLMDKVIISLKLESPKYTTEDLIQTVDQFVESLSLPFVTDVVSGISLTREVDEMFFF